MKPPPSPGICDSLPAMFDSNPLLPGMLDSNPLLPGMFDSKPEPPSPFFFFACLERSTACLTRATSVGLIAFTPESTTCADLVLC